MLQHQGRTQVQQIQPSLTKAFGILLVITLVLSIRSLAVGQDWQDGQMYYGENGSIRHQMERNYQYQSKRFQRRENRFNYDVRYPRERRFERYRQGSVRHSRAYSFR